MMSEDLSKQREQIQFFCTDQLVPENHLLRKIDKAISFTFIYDLVRDKYADHIGRPSIDPVMLLKIPMIQYLYGIKSMRQTMKEIEVNIAYRWFLGLSITDPVPHFSTFGKNYTRRFKDTDLFEQIFTRILEMCYKYDFVDPSVAFVDATHIKASANKRKAIKHHVAKEAASYHKELIREIQSDRADHGKKALKDKNKDDDDDRGPGGECDDKTIIVSTVDPESGMFHKGDHKREFAYVTQTACDKHGWVLDYSVHPGNEHDSKTFPIFYEKLKKSPTKVIVADSAYKTPAIAKLLIDDGIIPVLPYKRPMTKKGFFRKHEYVYDEHFDCYICPNNKVLDYKTTNRQGYREYASSPILCEKCPHLESCTLSQNHTKVVQRHVWQDYLDYCDDIRHDTIYGPLYNQRKETIERIFGTAKENHGMRYTRHIGMARMRMKVGLTFACMNMKKLATMLHNRGIVPA